jgi:hypothetical protein
VLGAGKELCWEPARCAAASGRDVLLGAGGRRQEESAGEITGPQQMRGFLLLGEQLADGRRDPRLIKVDGGSSFICL